MYNLLFKNRTNSEIRNWKGNVFYNTNVGEPKAVNFSIATS